MTCPSATNWKKKDWPWTQPTGPRPQGGKRAPWRCGSKADSLRNSMDPLNQIRIGAKREKDPQRGPFSFLEIRRRPTLPGSLLPSTIGAGGLNFRVRNGNGCDPTAIATETFVKRVRQLRPKSDLSRPLQNSIASTNICVDPSPRPISTGRLNALPHLHLRPINVVVFHGPYQINSVGDLILERVSHLDAFSGYPFRRSLTSHALGRTTGTRELRPSRSSRTRDSLPQISYGCRG